MDRRIEIPPSVLPPHVVRLGEECADLERAGANVFVSGSALFDYAIGLRGVRALGAQAQAVCA